MKLPYLLVGMLTLISCERISASANTRYYFADIDGDGKADQIRWNHQESPGGYSQGTLRNYLVSME